MAVQILRYKSCGFVRFNTPSGAVSLIHIIKSKKSARISTFILHCPFSILNSPHTTYRQN